MKDSCPPQPYTDLHVSTLLAARTPPLDWSTVDQTSIKSFSLVFVVDTAKKQLLLGMKKRGFAAGLWNGFGGKPEVGESIFDCARRELAEEAGITVKADDLYDAGELYVTDEHESGSQGARATIKIGLFVAQRWQGQPTESDEMRPHWFELGRLPFDEMWPEARYYLPYLAVPHFKRDRASRLMGRIEYRCADDISAPETVVVDGEAQQLVGLWLAGVHG